MSDSESDYYSNSEEELDSSFEDDEDEELDEVEEWYENSTISTGVELPTEKLSLVNRVANERFVDKKVVYEGGISAARLSLYELTETISLLAQTIENGREPECDKSLIESKFITTIDLAIAELEQKKCPYLIMREHLGGAFEVIDPNLCSFNAQDIREHYLHNMKKSFD